MERFQPGHSWIERACFAEARRRRTIGRAISLPVVAGAILWLALGLASKGSWALSAPQAGASQNGNEKVARAPRKAEETPPPPSEMSYTTSLDRTAVWVGDQFHYRITVDYSSEFEFVLDNLNKENVNLDPFPVIDVTKETRTLNNGKTRLLVDITLANFSLNQTEVRIPQMTLYYFRRDQHTNGAEQAAAEGLTVAGPMIGLRSTLPPNPADIRDSATVFGWARSRWVVPIAGFAALACLVAWLGWEAFFLVKRRSTAQGPDRRVSMETVRARWASGVPSDFSDGRVTREFFDRSYQDLKEYLSHYLETDTAGLTGEEIREKMQLLGASSDVTQKVAKVLGACEAARYSRDGIAANAESARGIAQDVREILSHGLKEV
jgi:hypothetical protein